MNKEFLIKKYGTPLFIYDCNKIRNRISYLKSIFKNMKICYAIKANTFVIREIYEYLDRIEICSEGEYQICKTNSVDSKKYVLSGVYKELPFFESIFKNNIEIGKFTIESIEQFNMLKLLTDKYKKQISVLVRLTSENQFGVSENDIEYIIENNNSYISISGIEYFSGTQKKSIDKITKECEIIKNTITRIETKYSISLTEIEYGPGLPINYFNSDNFDEQKFLIEVNKIINESFKSKSIILEIGRSLVAESGTYCTRVVDLKQNSNGIFAILDGGINHLVYYDQMMSMKTPYYEIIGNNNTNSKIVNLCGPLCTANDIIVKQLNVPKLNIGDIFAFKNIGAYSITEGISLFLSRDMPKVILINGANDKIVRDKINTYKINCPVYGGD